MSLSLIFACLWVVAASVLAMLPVARQYAPGLVLMIVAPFLILLIWSEHGGWVALIALVGFVSIFRRPLAYFGRKGLALWTRPRAAPRQRRSRDLVE